MQKLRVLSLYDGFFVGGSRIIHSNIISALNQREDQEHSVLSLTNRVTREYTVQKAEETPSWVDLSKHGVHLEALNREMGSGWSEEDLEQIQVAIDSADVVLSLKEQPLVGLETLQIKTPLIVCLHRSDPENQGKGTQDLLRTYEKGSLTKIISCAESTKTAYVNIGLPSHIIEVIPNGINLDRFVEDTHVRDEMREAYNVPHDAPVVSIAARFDGMKNIQLFIQAAGEYLKVSPDAHFFLCGAGMTRENPAFQKLLNDFIPQRLHYRFHALGISSHVSRVYNATDIIALSSAFGEAAPLCLLEGMACGAVPVATDVGDCALMVQDRNLIAPLEAKGMSDTWVNAYARREYHKEKIRMIRDSLSEKHMIQRYADILNSFKS